MTLQLGLPGHKAEPQPVVDHGEAAGRQAQPPPNDAGDVLALDDAPRFEASLLGDPIADRLELAPTQPLDQVGREPDAIAVPPRQALRGEMVDAALDGGRHHKAEPSLGERRRRARRQLAVQPGRARCAHLGLQLQVGAHRDHQDRATTVLRFGPARLDDGADTAVAGRLQARQPHVVGATVDAVDDHVGGAFKFVVEPARSEAADHGPTQACAVQHIVAGLALSPERLVQPGDDVAPLAELAKPHLQVVRRAATAQGRAVRPGRGRRAFAGARS